MAGSGPTTALAAATAFSQVSVTGIGDPESSVPAEAGALLSHTTFGAAAVLGDGEGGLLDGGAGDAGVLAEGGAETDGAEVLAEGGAKTDGTGVAHPAAMARSTIPRSQRVSRILNASAVGPDHFPSAAE
jgi:hypothetical protein